jgi:hypothetical protein
MMPNSLICDTIKSDAFAIHGTLRDVDHETDLFGAGDRLAVLAVILPTLALK